MSVDGGRHEAMEELISASLNGELNEAERQRLDVHLDGCARCRQTLAAFAEQRRVVAGLRHMAPPRDLGARVRAGIEAGRLASVPWWRRPVAIFTAIGGSLAAVAGVLLALVILGGIPDSDPVGEASASPTPMATASVDPTTVPASPSVAPSASVAPTPTATPEATPPATIGRGAVNYLQWEGTLADSELSFHGWDPMTDTTAQLRLDLPDRGQPQAAALSPDYRWLAYQVPFGQKGTNQVLAVHLMTSRVYELGETPDGSVFSQRMSWSPDSRYLAYTRANVDQGAGPDAWLFDTESGEPSQATGTGSTYVAGFVPAGDAAGSLLVSVAGETPVTYPLTAEQLASGERPDPGAVDGRLEAVFQPLLSPDGRYAVFWRGAMRQEGAGWAIDTGGMLYLTGEPVDGSPSWSGEELFPTLPVEQDALGSAQVEWSYDSDRFAVWNVEWRGVPLEEGDGGFPSRSAVYLGRATARDLIDGEEDGLRLANPDSLEFVSDVTFVDYLFGNDAPALAATIFEASSGESGDSPVAQSRLVVVPSGPSDAGTEIAPEAAWVGPALYVPQGGEGR